MNTHIDKTICDKNRLWVGDDSLEFFEQEQTFDDVILKSDGYYQRYLYFNSDYDGHVILTFTQCKEDIGIPYGIMIGQKTIEIEKDADFPITLAIHTDILKDGQLILKNCDFKVEPKGTKCNNLFYKYQVFCSGDFAHLVFMTQLKRKDKLEILHEGNFIPLTIENINKHKFEFPLKYIVREKHYLHFY